MAHSLVVENQTLLQDLVEGTVTMRVIKDAETGEREQRMVMELPPEEAFESFAARLRPFTMRDEPVYWELVLDAIEDLVPQDTLDEVIDVDHLREAWVGVTQGKKTAQAYFVMTDKGQTTDLQLADDWLYSHALHARVVDSAVGKDLGLDERYRAAAGIYARLGAAVNGTYNVIAFLVRTGLLELDESVFTERVVANTTIDQEIKALSSDVGAPMPADMSDPDPEVWRPAYEEIEEFIEARKQAERCDQYRGTREAQIRWPDGKVSSATWGYQAR